MNDQPTTAPGDAGDSPDRYDQLESILHDLRSRGCAAPQWEFCEGFMAALQCSRREIAADEYLPRMLSVDDDVPTGASLQTIPFADELQRTRFIQLWADRWDEVAAALDVDIESLDDERAYSPELLDMRGLVVRLPTEERDAIDPAELPAFGQLWALGFIDAVEIWEADWAPPREREARELIGDALDAISRLIDDDTAVPDLSPFDDDDPPSVSGQRFDAFGSALWAVYDLHDMWRSLGPRIEPLRKEVQPGRNDPCPCGSGKKFKKCHGG